MNIFPRTPVDELKNNKKEILFQITDWFVPESDRNQDKDEEGTKPQEYSVLIYGTNDDGNTICTKVINFKPFFYVKPPPSWEELSDTVFEHKVGEIEMKLREEKYECKGKNGTYNKKIISKCYDDHLEPIEFIKKKDFWGFTNNKEFRFLKISVNSYYLYNNLKYYFQSDKVVKEGFKLYESNIDPFLKLIHIQKIKPCSWIKINKYSLRDAPDTTCDYNITANWSEIEPVDINKIAPLIIASFDIECTSSHGDFPVAIKNYKKLSQDLCYLAKAGLDDENLIDNIYKAYTADVNINSVYKIHRLYTKRKIDDTLKEKLKANEADIRFILNKIKTVEVHDNDNDDEEEDDDQPVRKITTKEINEIEESLNLKLTRLLPELKGDEIIQIGTTVNRYGSDEIIYKNIITLNSCDEIEDTEVISCKTEADLLMAWKRLMMRLNPDVLIGYNIWGFDIEYIWNRCKEVGILENFRIGLGRLRNRKSVLTEQKLASSAMGENILKLIDMDGVVCIDVFKVMQREYKLDSYKLDNVASIYIGEKKDDLKPKEIFEKFKGNSADRCVIAKYCIQDCILVNKLLHKLKILENNIGMGNVCLVPLNYLFRRGQGIKIFSLIGNECMKKGYLIPVIKNFIVDDDIEGYEGAIVLDPKEGIYLDEPIIVFDYGSLYPSSMICRNLSHDTYILDKKYLKVDDPNIEIIKVSYDLYEGLGDKKTKVGVKDCLFAAYKDGRKGIIPEVLDMLLTERKNTRKKIEYSTITTKTNEIYSGFPEETDTSYILVNVDTKESAIILKENIKSITQTYNKFECDVFDALQVAYKVTANSLYGQIGARTSPIYLKDIAACTTSTGREMIMIAKKFVEDNYNADVIYGDSVMPYTPITYKIDNQLFINTFEKIEGKWTEYNNFKPDDTDRFEKEQINPLNMKVWTNNGWATVKRIIRHKTVKKIYRVLTHTGLVDVTEDHSLLDNNCQIIKPCNCVVGQKLLHSKPEIINGINGINDNSNDDLNDNSNLSAEQAYIYGMFCGDGSCGSYDSDYGIKYSWAINNSDMGLLIRCKEILEKIENIPFKILDTMKSSGVYKLVPYNGGYNSIKNIVIKYRNKCYLDKEKIVPNEILNCSDIIVLEAFRKGLVDSDGNRKEYAKYGCLRIDTKNQVTAQSYVLLFQLLNYSVSINTRIDKPNIYRLSYTKLKQRRNPIAIKKLEVLHENYDGYVYDIETESGNFHGGIGNIILKNTDSIFCKFNIKDEEGNELYGKEALPYAIKIGKDIEKNIVGVLPYPQKLNYEKCLYPFILFSKKRYVGNLYETDVTKFKQKSMGIVLKRRDNANIVKKIYGGIIDIILNQQDLELSIKFLREELNDLVEGKADFKDLILSKNLRGFYKDPTKIAHKVLADRIAVRDPGNKPSVNDRIPYIYIKVKDAKLQGDKIENPEYIIENHLEPDYLHYITNQIMKPVLQLYALCLKDLNDYKEGEDYWDNVEADLKLKEMYKDDGRRKRRMDNLKLLKVQEILFDEFINKLKEPKVKKVREVKVKEPKVKEPKEAKVKEPKEAKSKTKNAKEAKEGKEEISDDKVLTGDFKIIDSKVKNSISYKVIIKKDSKVIYTDEKEFIKEEATIDKDKKKKKPTEELTKDKIIRKVLSEIYEKHKENVIKLTLNYKGFIKYYSEIKSKYNEFIAMGEVDPANNDISITKLQKEMFINEDMIKIKDNIVLVE